jgi:hypothetical protein
MDEVDDADLVVERVAALDLGKAGLEACVRVPHPQRPGRRMQELRGYATTTAQRFAVCTISTNAWLRVQPRSAIRTPSAVSRIRAPARRGSGNRFEMLIRTRLLHTIYLRMHAR